MMVFHNSIGPHLLEKVGIMEVGPLDFHDFRRKITMAILATPPPHPEK